MISKERLEELIKKKALVWKIYKDTCNGAYLVPADLFGIGFSSQVDETTPFNELFETKEEAEWHKEFKRIPRTDYLDLPTWKELNHTDDKRFHFQSKHNGPVMIWIDIFDLLNIEAMHSSEERYCYEATKENYTLACRKAKELFLGEENVKDN